MHLRAILCSHNISRVATMELFSVLLDSLLRSVWGVSDVLEDTNSEGSIYFLAYWDLSSSNNLAL